VRGGGVRWEVVPVLFGLPHAGDLIAEDAEVEGAEEYEHEADGELHGEAEARWDNQGEEDDGRADCEDGDGVACAPERADESCA